MKEILTDHGRILHTAGVRRVFPARGAKPEEISFAAPGELEGRTPIGWQQFFPALRRADAVVVSDTDAGTLTVVPRAQAPSPS